MKLEEIFWRRHPDLNRRITVLQRAARPLGKATYFNNIMWISMFMTWLGGCYFELV